MQQKTDRVAVGVVGCFLGFLVLVAALVIGVVVWARSRPARSVSTTPASTVPARRPGQPIPAEPCIAPPGTLADLAEPLRVHDPARVDLAELYDQAHSLVLRLEPNARLTAISALKEATDGTFDSAEGNFSFNFEYRCLRAGAPMGQDLAQGMLLVFTQGGTVRASRVPVPEAPILAFRGALREPPCSTVAAWATAVASGVPASARATFLYMEATGNAGGASWLVTVPGHPFKREIDGESCRLRSNSPIHPDLTDPGAKLPDLHPSALPASPAASVAPTAELPPTVELPPTAAPVTPTAELPQEPPPSAAPGRTGGGRVPGVASAPEPQGSSGGGCTLNANSIPPSQVVIDGRPAGTTPRLAVSMPCGSHTVTFTHPDRGRKTLAITLTAGKPGTVAVKF